LYNILIEFDIPMKLVRLVKMCLNETYSRFQVGKHLSDTLPIKNGLKRGDHMEDPGTDGRIILKLLFKKWDGGGGGGMDWIDMTQDRERWRSLVNVVINLQVPLKVGNFLTS
jgi:hypothetical protein